MADYVVGNTVLTPYQIQYLKDSMGRFGFIRDLTFDSPDSFNEALALLRKADYAAYQRAIDVIRSTPTEPPAGAPTPSLPTSGPATPINEQEKENLRTFDDADRAATDASSGGLTRDEEVLPSTLPVSQAPASSGGTWSGSFDPDAQRQANSLPTLNIKEAMAAIDRLNQGASTTSSTSSTVQTPLENPLHEYEAYTYCLSWHLLSTKQFNKIVANPESSYIPENVLVSSAGKYSSTFRRNKNFLEDFYFEDFKMTTVMVPAIRNPSSNVIEMSFTLIEPNGFTLFNRLIQAVDELTITNGNDANNYTRQPYIIQIEFYGFKDGVMSDTPLKTSSGMPMTKIIPITLVDIKTRVSNKGVEYQIRAVPFNHQAFNSMYSPSPAALQIKGTTVSELLGSGDLDSGITTQKNQREEEKKISDQLETLGGYLESGESLPSLGSKTTGPYQSTGFTNSLNTFYQSLKNSGEINHPNRVRVVFDPIIGNSKLYVSRAPVEQAPTPAQTSKDTARASGNMPVGSISFDGIMTTVPLGQSIDKLIDWAVRNSSYIQDQLVDPEDGKKKSELADIRTKSSKPLMWYKIVPKIEIGEYDEIRNLHQYTITYYVKPWATNSKYPYAPRGLPPGYVKQYDWFFTGKNKDVLDMQINFDVMYFIQMTALRNKNTTLAAGFKSGTPSAGPLADANPNSELVPPIPKSPGNSTAKSKLQPTAIHHVGDNKTLVVRGGQNQAGAVAAADVQENLMLGSKGDMINLKLKILGDPQFIKQDDLFYGQSLTSPTSQLTPNGSLYTDSGELYVFVTFMTPIDYDERTGLAVPGLSTNNYGYRTLSTKSEFTGVYKVVKVESQFTKGKFEQTLELVRLPIYDDPSYATQSVSQRIDSYIDLGLGQNASIGARGRFTGPRILQNQVNNLLGAAAGGLGGLASQAAGALEGLANMAQKAIMDKGMSLIKDQVNSIMGEINFSNFTEGLAGEAANAYDAAVQDAIDNNLGYGFGDSLDFEGAAFAESLTDGLDVDLGAAVEDALGAIEDVPIEDLGDVGEAIADLGGFL